MTGLENVPSWENKHTVSIVRAENEGPPKQTFQIEPLVFVKSKMKINSPLRPT